MTFINIIKKLLSILLLLLTFSSCKKEIRCAEFKTGEFRYVHKNMPEKIIRTESMQIETNPNNNIVVKTTIEWISECEYILTYIEILNYKKDTSKVIGKKIYCEIIETNGNRIKVHAQSSTMNEVIEFIKIN